MNRHIGGAINEEGADFSIERTRRSAESEGVPGLMASIGSDESDINWRELWDGNTTMVASTDIGSILLSYFPRGKGGEATAALDDGTEGTMMSFANTPGEMAVAVAGALRELVSTVRERPSAGADGDGDADDGAVPVEAVEEGVKYPSDYSASLAGEYGRNPNARMDRWPAYYRNYIVAARSLDSLVSGPDVGIPEDDFMISPATMLDQSADAPRLAYLLKLVFSDEFVEKNGDAGMAGLKDRIARLARMRAMGSDGETLARFTMDGEMAGGDYEYSEGSATMFFRYGEQGPDPRKGGTRGAYIMPRISAAGYDEEGNAIPKESDASESVLEGEPVRYIKRIDRKSFRLLKRR